MTVNNAENGIDNALVNDLKELQRQFDEFRSTPQPIGNGSINYAIFGPDPAINYGPMTIAAGATVISYITLMNHAFPLTWNGLPAINQLTFFDYLLTVSVDVLDSAHAYPLGSALTGGQLNFIFTPYMDYKLSGLSTGYGDRTIIMPLTNKDSVSHTYYIQGNAIIPRPALKPL